MKGFHAIMRCWKQICEQKERTLLLFEDVNIQKLLGVERIKEICAFPIRFSQLEAAPVAMVAITDHI